MVFTKNKNGENFSIPTKQRALVLQGEGALGYYEIGVLQSLCNHLFNNTKSKDENDKLKLFQKSLSFKFAPSHLPLFFKT